jgi:hypothetical protein
VKPLEDSPAAATSPPPGGKGAQPDEKMTKWRDNLAKDPWVEETLNIFNDMTSPRTAAK